MKAKKEIVKVTSLLQSIISYIFSCHLFYKIGEPLYRFNKGGLQECCDPEGLLYLIPLNSN